MSATPETRHGYGQVRATITLALGVLLPVQCLAELPFPNGAHLALVERVGAAESELYGDVLTEFGAHLETNPTDHVAMVERCRFITHYAYQEEVTIESAYDESQECIKELDQGAFYSQPDVRLFLLEQKWGEEAIDEGEALISASQQWSAPQRASLHSRVSDLYVMDDTDKAGRHATIASELDPSTGKQIPAAEYQARIGARRKAIDLIRAMPADQWNEWSLERAVRVMLQADAPLAAYVLVNDKAGIKLERTARYGLARALLDAGETKAGNALLLAGDEAQAKEEGVAYVNQRALRELFELRRSYGTASEAVAAYQELRDAGWRADPFGWYRLSLARTSMTAPWRVRDLAGIGTLLLTLGVIALLPALVVVPVHYRSVAKRLRGFVVNEPTKLAPWSLSQMWYAIAAIMVLMTLALYLFAYPQFEAIVAAEIDGIPLAQAPVDDRSLGRAYLFGSALCILAMIPLLRGTTARTFLATHWSVTRSLLVGGAMALGFVFIAAVLKGLMAASGFAIGPGSETVRGMQGIREGYGFFALFAFACLMTPLLEEFVFRGVMLRTNARHLALWISVLIQAIVFVLWHEDAGDYPALFLFALACTWLAMRSGGLAAPIAFHAVVNLVAITVLAWMSDAINPGG